MGYEMMDEWGDMSDVKEEERKKSKWRIIYAEVRVHSLLPWMGEP